MLVCSFVVEFLEGWERRAKIKVEWCLAAGVQVLA